MNVNIFCLGKNDMREKVIKNINAQSVCKQATCKDVARLAGVTHTTVSRVLNNSGYVADDTRRAVLEAVRHIGYKPNSAARVLAGQKQETIGVITEFQNEESIYGGAFVAGVSMALSEMGYRTAMAAVAWGTELSEVMKLPIFDRVCLDGVILDLHKVRGEFDSFLSDLNLPYVVINPSYHVSSNAIMPNDFEVARQAAEYLMGYGHKKIAYMPKLSTFTHGSQFDRMKGYANSMNQRGLSCIPLWNMPLTVPVDAADKVEGKAYRAAVKERLSYYINEMGCTGIVAYDMRMAARIICEGVNLGLSIPKDFSLISCDYDVSTKVHLVEVTAFKLDRREMAKAAVDMLFRKITDNIGDVNTVYINGQLVEGDSVIALVSNK